MTDIMVPQGFEVFPQDGTFNDALAPLAYQLNADGIVFALQVGKQHSNIINSCHGGVLMTFIDLSLSAAVCYKIGEFSGTPSIALSVDFLSKAPLGEWIYAHAEVLRVNQHVGFAQGLIKRENGETILRASGTFKLPANTKLRQKTTELSDYDKASA